MDYDIVMKSKLMAFIVMAGILSLGAYSTAFAVNAFAQNNGNDDKNNPTFPGSGAGKKFNEHASENTAENCAKHSSSQSGNLPAQCY